MFDFRTGSSYVRVKSRLTKISELIEINLGIYRHLSVYPNRRFSYNMRIRWWRRRRDHRKQIHSRVLWMYEIPPLVAASLLELYEQFAAHDKYEIIAIGPKNGFRT